IVVGEQLGDRAGNLAADLDVSDRVELPGRGDQLRQLAPRHRHGLIGRLVATTADERERGQPDKKCSHQVALTRNVTLLTPTVWRNSRTVVSALCWALLRMPICNAACWTASSAARRAFCSNSGLKSTH